jgi:hypothetical protein
MAALYRSLRRKAGSRFSRIFGRGALFSTVTFFAVAERFFWFSAAPEGGAANAIAMTPVQMAAQIFNRMLPLPRFGWWYPKGSAEEIHNRRTKPPLRKKLTPFPDRRGGTTVGTLY